MTSLSARLTRLLLRACTYPLRRRHASLSRSVQLKDGGFRPPHGFTLRTEFWGGVRTEVLLPPRAQGALLHFHGGGHTQPMNDMYRRIALRYAQLTGRAVFSPCYTAGEDKTYPSVHDECFAAYRAFAARCGMENTVAAGDSFGANLLLSACLRAREAGLPLPQAIACISPYIDLAASGDSYRRNCHKDPLYALPQGESFAEYEQYIRRRTPYIGGADARDALLSPAYADYDRFPPVLIVWGSLETSASDGEMLAARLRAAGRTAYERPYEGMWHDFLYLTPFLPESRRAWREIASFLREDGAGREPDIS